MTDRTSITILTTNDIGDVQGSTEQYYVVEALGETHDVHLFAPTDPSFNDIEYHHLPNSGPVPALIWYNIILLPVFLLHVINVKPDIFYTYKGFLSVPVLANRLFGIMWICDLRTEPTEQDREIRKDKGQYSWLTDIYFDAFDILYRTTLPEADKVFALSEELMQRLRDNYDVAEDQLILVPLGVDTGRFEPNIIDSYKYDRIDIVYVGTVRLDRGLEICLESIAGLSRQDQIQFHVIGKGPQVEVQELKSLAKEFDIEDQVTWHGFVDHEKLHTYLAEMNFGMSPTPARERYIVMSPAKVYEYLAMGLPVICSDLSAHRRILEDGQTGFFFEPGDSSALTQQIERVLELDPQELEVSRELARNVALENDWNERIKTIEDAISNVNS